MPRAQNVRMTGLIKRSIIFVITAWRARRSETSGGFLLAAIVGGPKNVGKHPVCNAQNRRKRRKKSLFGPEQFPDNSLLILHRDSVKSDNRLIYLTNRKRRPADT